MSAGEPGRYRAGQTALLAKAAEAEPLVGHWRQRFDPSAAAGVPAHVTVLFPFLDADLVSASVIGDLTALIAGHSPLTVRFDGCGRFPDVLYLAPDPTGPLRALTESVAARWPEAPPYGGQFAEVVPHLTVAHGQPSGVFDEVEAELADRLPVSATISSVSLYVSDGQRWRCHTEFPMLGASGTTSVSASNRSIGSCARSGSPMWGQTLTAVRPSAQRFTT
ncbi:2'-5' RNA ligase [Streptacidiphilus sp. MAP12-33]|uniref:2'-5' RNA ligase family protein n=1 Tax=Streptacidiphilus sp. MAP12-33 TaxID=3156266 RepID=UPI00351909FC